MPEYSYYALTGLVPAHYAAVALHPKMKFQYFEEEWEDRPDWVTMAKSETTALWNEKYRTSIPSGGLETLSSQEEEQWEIRKRARLAIDTTDELERFQKRDEEIGIAGGLEYWVKKREMGGIPGQGLDLINMGIAIHSIPGMSAEPECVFSRYGSSYHSPALNLKTNLNKKHHCSSKLLLSDRRNRLGDDVIEACECMKAWQKDGFLLSQDVNNMERMLADLEQRAMSLEKAKGSQS